MRYTIFDPSIPDAKNYNYTPEQLEYIVGELNNNSRMFAFLDSPYLTDFGRVAGRLKDNRIEENGSITSEIEYMNTPMGIISKQLEETSVNLGAAICGTGNIKNNIVEDYTISHVNIFHDS